MDKENKIIILVLILLLFCGGLFGYMMTVPVEVTPQEMMRSIDTFQEKYNVLETMIPECFRNDDMWYWKK